MRQEVGDVDAECTHDSACEHGNRRRSGTGGTPGEEGDEEVVGRVGPVSEDSSRRIAPDGRGKPDDRQEAVRTAAKRGRYESSWSKTAGSSVSYIDSRPVWSSGRSVGSGSTTACSCSRPFTTVAMVRSSTTSKAASFWSM